MKTIRYQIEQFSKPFDRYFFWHYCALGMLIGLGLVLRFWNLDMKPLWLDEVITAVFSLGHSYRDIPLDVSFSLADLDRIFSLNPGSSCAQVGRMVATESVHPPLFFCLMYQWMSGLQTTSDNLVWVLRSLPAVLGVAAIGSLYWLNRIAFSPTAGLMGAAIMAVSPFAVYLSQEARHYTLPMLILGLALAALVQMQQDLQPDRQVRPEVWLGWVVANVLGLYVHYFFVLALVAQIGIFLIWMVLQRRTICPRNWAILGLAVSTIAVGYLPWLPTIMGHFSRPETNWLKPQNIDLISRIAPIYQAIAGWIVMVITLPVEGQPWQIVLPMALLMVGFSGWLAWQIQRGLRQLWHEEASRPALVLLAGFIVIVLVEFAGIVYILNKDITVVPRYNFVYFPGVCALVGAALAHHPHHTPSPRSTRSLPRRQTRTLGRQAWVNAAQILHLIGFQRVQVLVVLVGILSSILVVNDLAFQKAYYPDRVARNMAIEPSKPLMLAVSYRSLQEVALGLSFALELRQNYPDVSENPPIRFAFLNHSSAVGSLWDQFPKLSQPLPPPLNLWVVATPGMKTKDYAKRLVMDGPDQPRRSRTVCLVDPEHYHIIGFPYQLYRCERRTRQVKG